jgi:nicotinamidase-related amidase
MYTLVVIDMQPSFEASQEKAVLRNCAARIKQAQKDNAAILLVEYEEYGKTDYRLRNLLKTYDKTKTVIKCDNDGSVEIKRAIIRAKFPKDLLRVCGVNTDYCVYESVKGLTKQMPKATIEVLTKSCNSNWNHEFGVGKLKDLRKQNKAKLKIK